MRQKLLTKSKAEAILNKAGIPEEEREENGGRVSQKFSQKYGTWLRKHDRKKFDGYHRDMIQSLKQVQKIAQETKDLK